METKPRFGTLAVWGMFAPHCYSRIQDWIPGLLRAPWNRQEFDERLVILEDAAGFTEDALHYLSKDQSERSKQIEEALVFQAVDDVLKKYLQTHTLWSARDRVIWLTDKIRHTLAYVRFLDARNNFMSAIRCDSHLSVVASRLYGQAVEVEAGAYACRDLQNVLKELRKVLS